MKFFTGIAASPGIAVGRLKTVDRHRLLIREQHLPPESMANEILRFDDGISTVRHELQQLKKQLSETTDEEHLFFIDTHLMILSDERLFNETVELIESRQISAENALQITLQNYQVSFAAIADEYLRERITDVELVVEKILHAMTGTIQEAIIPNDSFTIVAAHDFSPSDLLQMDREKIIGVVTEAGGKTSHASILARAFNLASVVGLDGIADHSFDGKTVIVDGLHGNVVLNPDPETLSIFLERKRLYEQRETRLREQVTLPSLTLDGHELKLLGNVEVPQEVPSVLANGGVGIGLYRTEMIFMNRRTLPDEEEQFQEYRAVQQSIAPFPLTIRTIDAGGDKLLDGGIHSAEQNPALGMRAIRLSLTMPDEFKQQLRAILRVSAFGTVKIMFPMISGIEELRSAKALLEECKLELTRRGIAFDTMISTGVMIEVPSAVTIADLLAREADFFSIGTNDLIQYTLALDRSNEQLTNLYQPLHPAVLRALSRITGVAKKAGITSSLCGEMAGDPFYLPILLGLGFNELSMGAASIPRVKQVLRRCDFQQATRICEQAMTYSTVSEVEAYLRAEITTHFAESFD